MPVPIAGCTSARDVRSRAQPAPLLPRASAGSRRLTVAQTDVRSESFDLSDAPCAARAVARRRIFGRRSGPSWRRSGFYLAVRCGRRRAGGPQRRAACASGQHPGAAPVARDGRCAARSRGPDQRSRITEHPGSLGLCSWNWTSGRSGSGRVIRCAVLLAVGALALASAPAEAFDCGGTAGPARVGRPSQSRAWQAQLTGPVPAYARPGGRWVGECARKTPPCCWCWGRARTAVAAGFACACRRGLTPRRPGWTASGCCWRARVGGSPSTPDRAGSTC